MKLKQYLNEGKTTRIDLPREDTMESLEALLTKNCQPYLKTISGTKKLLFRGTNQTFKMAEITPRKSRTPKDTPLKYHKLLDKLFNTKFGWKPRSTGIFCSGRMDTKRGPGTKIFDPASPNGKLMIAVCKIILTRLVKTKYGLTEKDWYYGDDVKI